MLKDLLIIIPALNEEFTLEQMLPALCCKCDVLVVNDCSTDSTGHVAASHGAQVINNTTNLGYTNSCRLAVKYAICNNYRYVVTADADGQHDVQDILNVANLIESRRLDLVTSNRSNKGSLVESIAGIFTHIFFKTPDLFCGLKGYDLDSNLKHVTRYINSKTNDINTELALRILKSKCDTISINIRSKNRVYGDSRFGKNLQSELRLVHALIAGLLA